MGLSLYEIFWQFTKLAAAPLAGATAIVLVRRQWICGRGRLRWAAMVCGILAALLWIGGGLLELFGLTWRNGAGLFLMGGALASGVVALWMAVAALFRERFPGLSGGLHLAWRLGMVLSAALLTFYACTLGVVWTTFTYGWGERVVDRQGQRYVEVKHDWLDVSYSYHRWYGPFFMGAEQVFSAPERPGAEQDWV